MLKFLTRLPTSVCLVFLGLLGFTVTAHAAGAVLGDDTPTLELVKAVLQAFTQHEWALSAPLMVILLVALAKRYLGDRWEWLGKFLHSNLGGSVTALLMATAGTLVAALAVPGAAISTSLLWTALRTGITAAGGYAVLKNVLVDPLLKPLADKAPGWLKPILDVLLFAFDHGTGAVTPPAIAAAEKAGSDAVAATQGGGVGGVVGKPGDLP